MMGILYYDYDEYSSPDVIGIFSSAEAADNWIWKEFLSKEKPSPDIEYGVRKEVSGNTTRFKITKKKGRQFYYEIKFIFEPYEIDKAIYLPSV